MAAREQQRLGNGNNKDWEMERAKIGKWLGTEDKEGGDSSTSVII